MIEPAPLGTALPDEAAYREILTSIIQRYVRLVGIPAALAVARRVPGLTLDEQGVFVLGYYHQRAAFYVKNGEKAEVAVETDAA